MGQRGKFRGSWCILVGLATLAGGAVWAGPWRSAPAPAQRPAVPAAVLSVRSQVVWTIEAAENRPTALMSGDSQVGPDGKIEVGPYGSVAVAGRTLAQARSALELHLKQYLKAPKVTLRLAAPAPPSPTREASAWPEPSVAPAEDASPALAPDQAVMEDAGVSVGQVVPIDGDPPGDTEPVSAAPAVSETAGEVETPVPAGIVVGKDSWQPRDPAELVVPSGTESGPPPANGAWRPRPDAPAPAVGLPTASTWRPANAAAPAAVKPRPAQPPAPGFRPVPRSTSSRPSGVIAASAPAAPQGDLPAPRLVPTAPDGAGPALAYEPPHPPLGPGQPPVPSELARVSLPSYVVDPPDILLVESTQQLRDQPVRGQHLIRPDGTIGLGIYGSVHVAGMTLEQAKEAIARQLALRIKDFDSKNLAVDVLAYNSKYYYVITDGGGYGEQVIRFPITGNETVLDAISQIAGLPPVASKKHIWVARIQGGAKGGMRTLPVDWIGITQRGCTDTNYQVMPGDRIYVKAQKLITADTALARFLSPIERIFGITLLGSTTVNSIQGRGLGFGNR